MPRLTLPLRILLALSAALFSIAPAPGAQEWEHTLSRFEPSHSSELRPVQVRYNFGWNGLTAATADLRLIRTTDGRFQLETTGNTTGLARTLWKFDVNNTSISDARTLRPIRMHEVETTRAKTLDTEVTFTPEGVSSRREERRGSKVKSKTRTFQFPDVLSLNSAMLFLRSKPLSDGAVERVVVYPSTSPYLCTVAVVGRERVTIPTGTFEAIKLDVQLNKIGKERELLPHKKFKRATVWLSNDTDHLVLRIEAQVFIGTVFVELQSVQFEGPKPNE